MPEITKHKRTQKLEIPGLTIVVGYDLPSMDELVKLAGGEYCVVLDRPESGKHPAHQRAMARWLARHINAGGKALVATHSDYLIKEVKLLIMLGGKDEHLAEIREKHGYAQNEWLDFKRVRCYTTKVDKNLKYLGISKKCPVDVCGFDEISSFYDTIAKQHELRIDLLCNHLKVQTIHGLHPEL